MVVLQLSLTSLTPDPTWKDPACVQLCIGALDPFGNPYNASDGVPLTVCADGSFCCGANWTIPAIKDGTHDCCNRKGGLFLENGKVTTALPLAPAVGAAPTVSSAAIATSSQSSALSPVTPTPTPTSAPSSSNTGPIIGGVVGGVAAVAILSLAFWYIMIRRKSRNVHQGAERELTQPSSQSTETYFMGKQQMWQEPSEAPDNRFRAGELDNAAARMELDGQQK
ncbi:hypothetical protein ACLMJK_007405 [Lecanora helva]